MAMAASGMLNRTALRGEPSAFLMELPPFRKPRIGQILIRSLLDRTLFVAGRALTVAAPAGLVLWIMGRFSLLETVSGWLEPVGLAMGMNGVILLAFCLSFPANELLIPIIVMTLSGVASVQHAVSIGEGFLQTAGWDWKTAICTMVFTLFHWPCSTTLITIYKETGSIRNTAAAFALPTAVGIILCLALNLVF